MYLDKAIDKAQSIKKIVSFGMDYHYDEQFQSIDEAYVLKIWDLQKLIQDDYNWIEAQGINGATIWD